MIRPLSRLKPQQVFCLLFVLILLALSAVITAPWVREQLAIDSCLDQGGRWNYQAGRCENEVSGP